LVIVQGTLLDRIDVNIDNTVEHTRTAKVNLQKVKRFFMVGALTPEEPTGPEVHLHAHSGHYGTSDSHGSQIYEMILYVILGRSVIGGLLGRD
jgi:hypothetical protein